MAAVVLSDLAKATRRVIEIFAVKGPKAFTALRSYWQPEYEGRRLNRQLEHLRSQSAQPEAAIARHLIQRFGHNRAQNPGLSADYLQLLSEQIIKIHQGVLTPEALDHLIQATGQLKAEQLDDASWRSLQFIATANGLFLPGFLFRNRTIERILQVPVHQLTTIQHIQRYFTAAMDANRFDLAADALAACRQRSSPDTSSLEQMQLHYHLMQGQRAETLALASRTYSAMDREFADFVRGKRVAIVGPAPGDESAAAEIDSFDIVIRTNYRGRDTMPPADEFGRKIDVSYYNYTYTKQVLGTSANAYLDDLSFAVFKNETDIRRYQGRPATAKFRTMRQINTQILNGKSQMVQNIVYDLLHFEPQAIKIFKSNFFMSEKRYYSTYASPTNQAQKASSFWMNFATHDLVTQLKFSQTLQKCSQISGDQQASEIMQLSPAEYMKKISQIYSI